MSSKNDATDAAPTLCVKVGVWLTVLVTIVNVVVGVVLLNKVAHIEQTLDTTLPAHIVNVGLLDLQQKRSARHAHLVHAMSGDGGTGVHDTGMGDEGVATVERGTSAGDDVRKVSRSASSSSADQF